MECTLCLCVVSSNERLIGYDKLCEICCSACIVSPLLNPVSTLYKGRLQSFISSSKTIPIYIYVLALRFIIRAQAGKSPKCMQRATYNLISIQIRQSKIHFI